MIELTTVIPEGWVFDSYYLYGMTYKIDGLEGTYRLIKIKKDEEEKIILQLIIREEKDASF